MCCRGQHRYGSVTYNPAPPTNPGRFTLMFLLAFARGTCLLLMVSSQPRERSSDHSTLIECAEVREPRWLLLNAFASWGWIGL